MSREGSRFNSRVAAMDRRTGEIIWNWKAHSGSGYVSLLLDGEELFVSVNGYMYCLDARSGREIWFNKMKGFGFGVTSMAIVRGSTDLNHLAQSAMQQARRRRNAST